MQIALTLLISAMQLLTLVASTPNLTTEFKNNAILIANHAVIVAQNELAKATTTVPQIDTQNVTQNVVQPTQTTQTQNVQNPQFSGIIVPMNKSEIVANLTREKLGVDPQEKPFGDYIITVGVRGQDGKYIQNADITLNGETKKTDAQSYERDVYNNILETKYTTFFVYTPTSTGDKVLTFTANGMSKDLKINVK